MWIVWCLLIWVGFCMLLSMTEDVPAVFRDKTRQDVGGRRIRGARNIGREVRGSAKSATSDGLTRSGIGPGSALEKV